MLAILATLKNKKTKHRSSTFFNANRLSSASDAIRERG